MSAILVLPITAFSLLLPQIIVQAQARSGMAIEQPWASEHIDRLPLAIRKRLVPLERACGNAAAAAHYFALSIEAGGERFVSLHFEDYACRNRAIICDDGECLHEIYVEYRGAYRIVFREKVIDLRMTNANGSAGIEVTTRKSTTTYYWNGRRFISRQTTRSAL